MRKKYAGMSGSGTRIKKLPTDKSKGLVRHQFEYTWPDQFLVVAKLAMPEHVQPKKRGTKKPKSTADFRRKKSKW